MVLKQSNVVDTLNIYSIPILNKCLEVLPAEIIS